MKDSELPRAIYPGPRTLFGRRAMYGDLNQVLRGPSWRDRLYDIYLRLRCLMRRRHRIVTDRWAPVRGIGPIEYHVGCMDCPKFETVS